MACTDSSDAGKGHARWPPGPSVPPHACTCTRTRTRTHILPSPPPSLPPQDPKDRDRVDRECRVMRNLSNHVGIIKLFEYVETRDYVYVMMEAARRG